MTPFIQKIQDTWKYKDRKQISGWHGLGGVQVGSDCLIGVSFENYENELDLDSHANMLNDTNVYTVNWLILC